MCMPLILPPDDYRRWLSDEPDPRDLMRAFPAEPMRMWPISTRVNKPENEPLDRRAHRVSYFGGVVELRATALARRTYCKTGSASNGREPMAFASRERRSKPDKEQQDAERDRLEAALEV